MPELPEVETVRLELDNAIKGACISKVTLKRNNLRIPFLPNMASDLKGRMIQSIQRRAKYLLFKLDNSQTMVAHLGMTGRFSVEAKHPKEPLKHDHFLCDLNDGRCLVYNDARRFGLITLCHDSELNTHPMFASLGPEPLGKTFNVSYLKKALSKRKSPIKTTIMDQSIVVGVGNIYASEALFLAGIDPRKPAIEVAYKSKELIQAIRTVLRAALRSGGSSLKDFVHVSGDNGYFQHHFNVYNRKGEACYKCQEPIHLVRQSGRSSFFCKNCQG